MTLSVTLPEWLAVLCVAAMLIASVLGLVSSVLQVQVKRLDRDIEREKERRR